MSFKNLDLNLLRVFDAVMAERNLSRAAAQLALTQPAISNAIARLRGALDDPLVVRIAGGIKPTPYAEKIVGLTIVEIDEGKNKKKRIRHKNKSKDISDDSTLQVGTTAGRNLFNLLVNEKRTPNTDGHANTSVILGPLAMCIDQWDASTVSSAKDDGNYDDEASGVVHVVQKVYIKSSSGFSVRV